MYEWIHFSAIFLPFESKLSKRCIVCVTMVIVLCSLLAGVYNASKYRFVRKAGIANNLPIIFDTCKLYMTYEESIVQTFITYSLGLWLPMFAIIVVHIGMYIRLKQQARIRAQHSTSDTTVQMKRTLKLFLVVVLAFITCTLPLSLFNCIKQANPRYYSKHLRDVRNLSIPLSYLNSCLNPLFIQKSIKEFTEV